MRLLRRLGMSCVICLGCQGLACVASRAGAPAEQLWEQGQEAMKAGAPDRAIALYRASLARHGDERNHLSLAAAYLAKGDDSAACMHLDLFLATHPEHSNARYYHAELLLKLRQPRAAQAEFERVIAAAQDEPELDYKHLVHCHTRLIEIGRATEDRYLVHLHRGIGMILLAEQRAGLADPAGTLPSEGLLCKAAAELKRARKLQPAEAQPCWYLHTAWRLLAQYEPARRWLAETRRHAPFAYLTPAERRALASSAP